VFNNCFSKIGSLGDNVKNIVGLDRPQMTKQHMHTACWIPKATDIHSEYEILIAFPLKQQLHEHTSVLSYMHIACLVDFVMNTYKSWTVPVMKPHWPSPQPSCYTDLQMLDSTGICGAQNLAHYRVMD